MDHPDVQDGLYCSMITFYIPINHFKQIEFPRGLTLVHGFEMIDWDAKMLSLSNIVHPGCQGGPCVWTRGEGAIYNLIL